VFAVAGRDWMLIQNLVCSYAVIFVLINLVVDVSYGWFDPRIRYSSRSASMVVARLPLSPLGGLCAVLLLLMALVR